MPTQPLTRLRERTPKLLDLDLWPQTIQVATVVRTLVPRCLKPTAAMALRRLVLSRAPTKARVPLPRTLACRVMFNLLRGWNKAVWLNRRSKWAPLPLRLAWQVLQCRTRQMPLPLTSATTTLKLLPLRLVGLLQSQHLLRRSQVWRLMPLWTVMLMLMWKPTAWTPMPMLMWMPMTWRPMLMLMMT